MDVDGIPLFNQRVWDANPDRAIEVALDALHTGGFDNDCIRRRVGNYEGQIMAIQRGWVQKEEWAWRINDAGIKALKDAGRKVPHFLPARDDWHSRTDRQKDYEYCVYEETRGGKPMLKLFKDAIPCGAKWGMDPMLDKSQATALRDYLNEWLARV